MIVLVVLTVSLLGWATRSRRLLLGIGAWLLATGLLAWSGVLSVWAALPPRWPLLPLTALVITILLARTGGAKAILSRVPRSWPIAAQAFRLVVELILYGLYREGRAPVQITFEGRNFDILVGLTAPLVAWLVVRRPQTRVPVIVWNVLGLLVLASTVATVATSTPGPLHRAWPGEPFTAIATFPIIWLAAFLVPLAVFFHIASLRQTGHTTKPVP